ncbi:MAG: hypothetical protein AAFO96_26035 [Bacteroidota bacterium]
MQKLYLKNGKIPQKNNTVDFLLPIPNSLLSPNEIAVCMWLS